ncbi:hypothetical protein HDU97_006682 [Phlyctochytrium planicorne]|nr:hypothetical protein HDU97_006682 [Phlyctochytrium planicorne]
MVLQKDKHTMRALLKYVDPSLGVPLPEKSYAEDCSITADTLWWVLDVLVTNWLGTYLGMKTCEYFAVKHYSWRGIKSIPSYQGKIQRSIQQFTPHSWTKFEWGSTKSFKNFLAVIALLYIVGIHSFSER